MSTYLGKPEGRRGGAISIAGQLKAVPFFRGGRLHGDWTHNLGRNCKWKRHNNL